MGLYIVHGIGGNGNLRRGCIHDHVIGGTCKHAVIVFGKGQYYVVISCNDRLDLLRFALCSVQHTDLNVLKYLSVGNLDLTGEGIHITQLFTVYFLEGNRFLTVLVNCLNFQLIGILFHEPVGNSNGIFDITVEIIHTVYTLLIFCSIDSNGNLRCGCIHNHLIGIHSLSFIKTQNNIFRIRHIYSYFVWPIANHI